MAVQHASPILTLWNARACAFYTMLYWRTPKRSARVLAKRKEGNENPSRGAAERGGIGKQGGSRTALTLRELINADRRIFLRLENLTRRGIG